MKNPFFNLPDFGGELLDLRLSLRLIVRQAFKPVHHAAPSHSVIPNIKLAFIPALKVWLQNSISFSHLESRIKQSFPLVAGLMSAVSPSVRPSKLRRVAGKSVSAKSVANKSLHKKGLMANSLSAKPASAKAPLGKSVYKGTARGGPGVGTTDNAASASRLVHPITPQPEKAREGMWVEYNKHAVVVARGNYTNNLKTGMWREYYDSGELMIEENFNLGVQHGRFATFHPNGQCCSEGTYNEGRREGRFFMYDESGHHVRTLSFNRDVLVEDVIVEERLAMA